MDGLFPKNALFKTFGSREKGNFGSSQSLKFNKSFILHLPFGATQVHRSPMVTWGHCKPVRANTGQFQDELKGPVQT